MSYAESEVEAELPQHPPKILMFAYSCHPTASMESRVGWYRAVNAASRFDTTVLYGDEYSEAELASHLQQVTTHHSVRFIKVPHSALGELLLRMPGTFYAAYAMWQRRAYRRALEASKETAFDLVHQVNFCGYREPGWGWKLPVPFVWGPVGGTHNFPLRFLGITDAIGGANEVLRNVVNFLQLRYGRRIRKAACKSQQIFSANSTTERDLKKYLQVESTCQLEIGIHTISETAKPPRDLSQPFRILWAGRLRAWKGLPLLLPLSRSPHVDYEIRILGEGCCKKRWQKLACKLGISSRIQWLGWPPYQASLHHYRWADILAFTSLRDTSGTGILEALAAGTPIVGLNHQGLADIIGPTSGVSIDVTSPRRVEDAFRETIMKLSADTGRLEALGRGTLGRAVDFHWKELADSMDRHYAQLLTSHAPCLIAEPSELLC